MNNCDIVAAKCWTSGIISDFFFVVRLSHIMFNVGLRSRSNKNGGIDRLSD